MSKRQLQAIQGAPMRKIVDRDLDRGYWTEILACGHTKMVEDHNYPQLSKFRRCYSCKWEKENAKAIQKGAA